MDEMPLFPLHSVLFPGTPINLHIFEPRYIKLIKDCISAERSFGVALIRSGMEAFGPLAEPHAIGCSAQIAQVQQLQGGRMNVVAIGQERFRILEVDREVQPYLIGRIQPYPIANPDPEAANLRAIRLRRQFDRFMQLLLQAGNQTFDVSVLPDDGVAFGYLAAAVLQISPLQKQELLAMERADRLLDRLQGHYRRELALLNVVLSQEEHLQAGGFSKN